MKKLLFKESQRNISIIAIIPAVLVAVLFGVLAAMQIGLKKPVGNHPAPDGLLVCLFLFSTAGMVLFSLQKLKFTITEDTLTVSFGLFSAAHNIPVVNIATISVRKYDALSEFMGWGVRVNSHGMCYTVSGNTGLDITLANGEKILIGTKQPEALQQVINEYFQSKKDLSTF